MGDAGISKHERTTDLTNAVSSRGEDTRQAPSAGNTRSGRRGRSRNGAERDPARQDLPVELPQAGMADVARQVKPGSGTRESEMLAAPHEPAPAPSAEQATNAKATADRQTRMHRRAIASLHDEVDVQERRYQDLFQFAPEAYLVTTTDGLIVEANHAAFDLLNLPRQSVLGRLLGIHLMSRAEHPIVAREMAALSSTPSARREWIGRLRRPGDTTIDVTVTVGGIRDAATDQLVGARWMIRDITALVAAQTDARRLTADLERRVVERTYELEARTRELAERTQEAEAANQAKAQFLAAMSHEIRTPLNAVAGYAELLEMGVHGSLTEQQQDFIKRIRRANAHLLAILNDILNFAKLESARVRFAAVPVSLIEIVEVALQVTAPQALAKRIALVPPSGDEPVIARADPDKVLQIALNLITNAVKFTDPSGEIAVSCGTGGLSVWLEVRDTGRGIAADQLQTIFEPFVQVGRSPTGVQEGVGLGLAISRDLARGMDGDLTVQSAVSKGSTFRLSLQRCADCEPRGRPTPATR